MFRLTSAFGKSAFKHGKKLLISKEAPLRMLGHQYFVPHKVQLQHMISAFSFSSNIHNKSKGFSGRQAPQPGNNRLKDILDVYALKYRKGNLSKEETIRMLANLGKMAETPNLGIKPAETIKYLTEALILAEKVGITDAIELGHIYNVIFVLYFTAGNLEKAEEFVNNAVAIYSKAAENGVSGVNARMIEVQFARANICYKREELDKARDSFLEIESKKDEIPKEDLVHCMPLVYDGLGDIYFKKRELAKVTQYREKAIAEVSNGFGEDSKEVIYYLNKLTDALVEEGDLSRALENGQKTLDICLKQHGEFSQESSLARIRVGFTHMKREEYDEGLKHYEKAMEVMGQIANFSKDQLMMDKILLARAYFETGRDQQANQIVNKVVKDLFDEGQSFEVAQCYSYWAEILATKESTKTEAVNYLQKAVEIYNKSSDEPSQIMKHYVNGQIFFFQGQAEESINELNKAIELNFMIEDKPKEMDQMYTFLGKVCLHFNRAGESIENFEKAIQGLKRNEQGLLEIEHNPRFVDLGMAYEQANQFEKAAEAYQTALDLALKGYSKKDKVVLGQVKLLRDVLEKLGRDQDVEKLDEEYKIV